jgi:hypothetical protein
MVTFTALLLPVLLAMTGLVLDGGAVYQTKRRLQTAADAGAMGGAHELWRGNTTGAPDAARSDVGLNGYTDANSSIMVNYPPASGPRGGDPGFVEVIVSQRVPTFLLRILNREFTTVRARAVAGLVRGAGGCVMALDPSQRGALTVQGTSVLTSGCGVMVNSSDEQAIVANGGGCIYAGEIGVAGGYRAAGSLDCLSPTPTSGVPPALDPMAWIAAPSLPSSRTATNFSHSEGDVTLFPGVYYNGIEISGGTVIFQPGIYILDGGGFRASGNAVLRGDGVLFYNTNTGGPGRWGEIDIAGTVQSDLVAPDDGPYEGILFWNDCKSPDRNPGSRVTGTADSRFVGALYFPSTHLIYSGTSATAAWTILIADTITIEGNAVVENDFDRSTVQPPTRLVTLVE